MQVAEVWFTTKIDFMARSPRSNANFHGHITNMNSNLQCFNQRLPCYVLLIQHCTNEIENVYLSLLVISFRCGFPGTVSHCTVSAPS